MNTITNITLRVTEFADGESRHCQAVPSSRYGNFPLPLRALVEMQVAHEFTLIGFVAQAADDVWLTVIGSGDADNDTPAFATYRSALNRLLGFTFLWARERD